MRKFDRAATGRMAVWPAVLLVLLAGAAGWFFYCPCERVPGGWLLGDTVVQPVTDWSFANDAPLCQVQVQAHNVPHSINLNCMSSAGLLYLSCAQCEGKMWSTAALKDPEARLRVGERVYPVTLTRITDDGELDIAWRARENKLGRDPDRPREAGWWSFRVESRSG
jgi:hypothetical protein